MSEYTVRVTVKGYIDVTVEANNFDDAAELAVEHVIDHANLEDLDDVDVEVL